MHPFIGDKTQSLEKSITESPVSFQTPAKSKQQHYPFKKCPKRLEFIAALLEKSVNRRLGSNGYPAIAKHSWFQGLDWSLVDKKGLVPDFIPDPTQNNYDFGAALEELLYESTPLPAKPVLKRKQRKERAVPPISFLWNDENTSSMETDLDYLDEYFPSYSKQESMKINYKEGESKRVITPPRRAESVKTLASSELSMTSVRSRGNSSPSLSSAPASIIFQDRKSSLAMQKFDLGSSQSTECENNKTSRPKQLLGYFDDRMEELGLQIEDMTNS